MNLSTEKAKSSSKGIQVISPSLPKGGGSVQGMGETFTPHEFSGAAGMTIPIPASPCRDFEPHLNLNYSSGNGNGPFGLGWELSTPEISRRTSKEIPRYTDDDTFLYTGDGYLVPILDSTGNRKTASEAINDTIYDIAYFQPRSQSSYDKITRYRNPTKESDTFWKITNANNVVSIFGKNSTARIYDPKDPSKVFKWLLEEVYDDKGNHQVYTYQKENNENLPSNIAEVNRDYQTQTYLTKVSYGNDQSITDGSIILGQSAVPLTSIKWHFEVVFNYGSYDLVKGSHPITETGSWNCRQDPFSDYNAGFEIRTYRLCKNILVFHNFEELSTQPVLTTALQLTYDKSPIFSLLKNALHTGYQYQQSSNEYTSKSLPALSFDYTSFLPLESRYEPYAFDSFEQTSGQVLSQGVNAPHFQLIDLYGEGIPGMLYHDDVAMYYQAPKVTPLDANALPPFKVRYGAPQTMPFPNAPIGKQHVLTDVTGDGLLDLLVSTNQQAGYYGLSETTPDKNFQAFESFPSDYLNPLMEQQDITGDGVADVLLIQENQVRFNASIKTQGFAPAVQVAKEDALPSAMPSAMPSAPYECLFFASMIGSGLSQRVRITQNQVECWPNLGYGKFGEKVIMSHAPNFGSDFNTNRLLWADIDGSGTTDLAYLHTAHIAIYLNQSGNSFAETPILIPLPQNWDPSCQVQFADVKGNGTNCLVFAKTHPTPQQWYYDFNQASKSNTESQKPWLLCQINNSMGAITEINYQSSTQYYLADQFNETPWITKLPFPVNVISSVTHIDQISETEVTSSYRYSHGYYDAYDREFRGFGRVDRTDASSFFHFKAAHEATAAYEAPPAFTRTWYHTGAFIEQEDLLTQYKKEYWNEDSNAYELPNTHFEYLTSSPRAETLRDAHRSLHGSVIRTEVYGNDDTPWQGTPYTVSETQFMVKEKQQLWGNKYSVFQHLERQHIFYDYERNAADPRTTHEFMLQHDYFGHVLKSCAVNYPRRSANIPTDMDTQTQAQQEKLWVSLHTESLFVSTVANNYWSQTTPTKPADETDYLIGLVQESKSHQVNELQPGSNGYFAFQVISKAITAAPLANTPLLHWERSYYYNAATQKELAFRKITAPALHHRTEFIEFDTSNLIQVFDEKVIARDTLDALMTIGSDVLTTNTHGAKGGYITFDQNNEQPDQENYYWNPGGAQSYQTKENFCLPKAYYDPFQYEHIYWDANSHQEAIKTKYTYDQYNLFANKVVDPLGNTTQITAFDYRHLHPISIQDINHNTASVLLDPIGIVIVSSESGTQAGESVGFEKLKGYQPIPGPSLSDIFSNPESYLQQRASFFYYDLDSWKKERIPNHTVHLNYTDYKKGNQSKGSDSIQKTVSYHDGFGRELQSKTFFNGSQETRDWDEVTQKVITALHDTCWLTSGATLYDDKGQPTQHYEPYFAPTWAYVNVKALNKVGYTDTLFYDALGRHVLTRSAQQKADGTPEGFFTKTLFGDLITLDTKPLGFTGYLNQKLYGNLGSPVNSSSSKYFQFVPSAWSSLVYDQNDCILDSDYQPQAGANIDSDAFNKAKAFANTPHRHIENGLGKVLQSEQLNIADENERNANFFTFDILGDELTSADQRLHPLQLNNFTHSYNLTKESIKVVYADAGTKWNLTDVVGHPIFSNDSRKTHQFHTYDVLLRPAETYVKSAELNIDQIVQKIVYGDSLANDGNPYFSVPSSMNLRGKAVIHFDQAGLNLHPSFDIHGHSLLTAQWLRQEYKQEANWSTITPERTAELAKHINSKYQCSEYSKAILPIEIMRLVELEIYITKSNFDAIGRIINSTDADGNQQTPAYYSTNWIKGLTTKKLDLLQTTNADAHKSKFSDVLYDAKGQRTVINYANGTKTYYSYDPFTFELTEIKSTRKHLESTIGTVQHLQYHHDPVGNVTSVIDLCAPEVFYRNQYVKATASYTYSALYQLTEATGREHAGMWGNNQQNQNKFNKAFFDNNWPQLTDSKALSNYTQTYQYDTGGNLLTLKHKGAQATTRNTTISAQCNRIATSGYGAGKPQEYTYDVNGNMTTLDGCPGGVTWNYRNNMQSAIKLKREDGTDDGEYYVYNAAGDRVRKVQELQGTGGITINEVIYLGGIEVRKTYTLNASDEKNIKKEWHVVRLEDGANTFCTWRYWVAGKLGTDEKKVQLRYQYSDSLNSSTLELDETAQLITYEEYYPYGGTSIAAATNQTEIKNKHYHYSNKEKDSSTGLYYYGMRYYCPWLGRWTCTDPAGTIDGLNIYAMVTGNPMTHVDVGGMGIDIETSKNIKSNKIDIDEGRKSRMKEGARLRQKERQKKLDELRNKNGDSTAEKYSSGTRSSILNSGKSYDNYSEYPQGRTRSQKTHSVFAADSPTTTDGTRKILRKIPEGKKILLISGTHGNKEGDTGAENKDFLLTERKLVDFVREDKNEVELSTHQKENVDVTQVYHPESTYTKHRTRSKIDSNQIDIAIQEGKMGDKKYDYVVLAFCFSAARLNR